MLDFAPQIEDEHAGFECFLLLLLGALELLVLPGEELEVVGEDVVLFAFKNLSDCGLSLIPSLSMAGTRNE